MLNKTIIYSFVSHFIHNTITVEISLDLDKLELKIRFFAKTGYDVRKLPINPSQKEYLREGGKA